MRQFPSVSERPTGKLATTQITNELAQAVLAMAPTLSSSQYQQHRSSGVQSVWLIWDKGPNGEDDYTDHRYWIRRAYLSNDGSDDATKQIALTEVPLPDGVSATDQWIQASNMAERPPNAGGDDNTSDASKGTHSLAKGTAIGPIWAQHDDNPPNTTRWMFNSTPRGFFPVKVTQNGGSDGNKTTAASWTYDVSDLADNKLTGDTPIGQEKPRPFGTVTAGSSYGVAFYDGSTLKLWDAGEKPGTGGCS